MAHVQLHELVVVRRVAHREAAPRAVLQQQVDVLPGQELQALVRRQLQVEDHHVVGRALHPLHPRRQLLDRDVPRASHLARLDDDIAERLRLAEERVTLLALGGGEDLLGIAAVIELALDQLAFARAAGAVAAAVRQDEAGIQRRLEDAFALLRGELMPGIAYRDLMRHRRRG